jgi:CPA2 family monovalent cation:H+ antiporter-2
VHPFGTASYNATYSNGVIQPDEPVPWADGQRVTVSAIPNGRAEAPAGPVIIAGFGLAGRCVADLLDREGIGYTIIEKNAVTVETQRSFGRRIVEGSTADAAVLTDAGLSSASTLALTIPDEEAVLKATSVARRLNPNVYIIARTHYSSKGMRAAQLGADDVVKAEQAVALQFYDKLRQRLHVPEKTETA